MLKTFKNHIVSCVQVAQGFDSIEAWAQARYYKICWLPPVFYRENSQEDKKMVSHALFPFKVLVQNTWHRLT